ncbi:MAG: tetratricopeptide repeat protein [Longimicrobiales bacterium]
MWQVTRNPIFRSLAAYFASAFVALQAADIFLPALLFPDWVLRFLVILSLLGLPVIAVGAWLGSNRAQPPGEPIRRTRRVLRPRVKRAAFLFVLLIAVVGGSVAFVAIRPESIPFNERDWVVLADCTNETSEPGIDQAIADALLSSMRQSRHANVMARSRLANAIERMRRKAGDPLTREIAIELAQREGLAGVITCSIAQGTGGYFLTATIVNPATSEVAWSYQVAPGDRVDLVASINELAREARAALGESRASLWREARGLARATTSSLDALKSYTQGKRAWSDGQYDVAIQFYEAAVRTDPEFVQALAAIGAYHYSFLRNDRSTGETYLRKAEALLDRVTERERLWHSAYMQGVRGNDQGAVTAYQAYVLQFPDDSDAWYNLGIELRSLQRCVEAIPVYQRALQIDSLMLEAEINLSVCYADQNDYASALSHQLKVERLRPEWFTGGNLNHELGLTYAALGRFDEARAVYGRRLQQAPAEQAAAHRSLGLLAALQGRYIEASRELQEAIRLARATDGRLAEMRNRLYLVEILERLGRGNEARAQLAATAALIETFSVEPWWLQVAGRRFALGGELERGRRLLAQARERSLADNVDDATAVNLLEGFLLLAEGKPEQAIDRLEAANSVRSDSYTRDPLARAYLAAGNLDRAREVYDRTFVRPEYLWEAQEPWFDSSLQLARIAEQRGDTASALRYYTALLQRWSNPDTEFPDLRLVRGRVQALAPR